MLGDFSARANSGKLDTGSELGSRKPLKVDCDNVDATIKRLGVKLRLPLGADGSAVELAVNSMDDLHPDQLYSNLPIFSELSGLRQRLKTQSTFAKAAKEVQAWAGVKIVRPSRRSPRSAAIPANGKLSDFARLVGAPTVKAKPTVSIAEMLNRWFGPYVSASKGPEAGSACGDSGFGAGGDDALGVALIRTFNHSKHSGDRWICWFGDWRRMKNYR